MSQYLSLESLCNSILNSSRSIQSVAFLNKMGKPIEKASRPSFAKQFPDYMNEMFLMQCVLQISMGKDFDEHFGPINYHISERKNLTVLSFPMGEDVMLVAINKNTSPITLAKKIVTIINEHRK